MDCPVCHRHVTGGSELRDHVRERHPGHVGDLSPVGK